MHVKKNKYCNTASLDFGKEECCFQNPVGFWSLWDRTVLLKGSSVLRNNYREANSEKAAAMAKKDCSWRIAVYKTAGKISPFLKPYLVSIFACYVDP